MLFLGAIGYLLPCHALAGSLRLLPTFCPSVHLIDVRYSASNLLFTSHFVSPLRVRNSFPVKTPPANTLPGFTEGVICLLHRERDSDLVLNLVNLNQSLLIAPAPWICFLMFHLAMQSTLEFLHLQLSNNYTRIESILHLYQQ